MIDFENDEEERLEYERPGPDLPHIWPAENCSACGKPGCIRGCMRCGKAVCIDSANYQNDSSCGGWILDWWTDGAMDEDDGNEFWCISCLKEEYGEGAVKPKDAAAPLTALPVVQTSASTDDQAESFDPFLNV